jgi:hypothetical protein
MKTFFVLLLSSAVTYAQSNTVSDWAGNTYDATTPSGYFWSGVGVGLLFYGFGWVLRLARRTTGQTDF